MCIVEHVQYWDQKGRGVLADFGQGNGGPAIIEAISPVQIRLLGYE